MNAIPPNGPRTVLGLETSCDETAAAIVRDGRTVLSSSVATQHDLHEEFGGVVPEIASRAHIERILPAVRSALHEAELAPTDLDAIAVGHRPGLIGALLVGTSAAKGFAMGLGIPFVGVDHVHAHLASGVLDREDPPWPALGLVVSGGHTSLYRVDDLVDPRLLGRTIDDALGEAFDKVASLLGLGHPGGPKLETLAEAGDPEAFDFPVANLGRDSLDFSFSGLKTAVRYATLGVPGKSAPTLDDQRRADLAASFQAAAIRALRRNLGRALDAESDVRSLVVGGGVIANRAVRGLVEEIGAAHGLDVVLPPMTWCQDNGAMIAALGARVLDARGPSDLDLAPVATSRNH